MKRDHHHWRLDWNRIDNSVENNQENIVRATYLKMKRFCRKSEKRLVPS